MPKENTILIVDDSKELVDALRAILEDEYNIRVALSGEVALRVLESVKPDLMLLDVMMPGIGGFGVVEIMNQDPELKKIPVIFISAENDLYNESRGLKLGAVDYVTKPYKPEIVTIKVRNAIENKMHRDSLERLVEKRTAEVVRSRDAVLYGMSLLAESRDNVTGDHINRIKRYSELLAKELHEMYPDMLSEAEARRIAAMSPIHDIGKVRVPDSVLLKPGKLTPEEFNEIKMHTVFGGEVLRKTQQLMEIDSAEMRLMVEIAESHHERYDGSGYPSGLKGDEIPLSARIVAIADVYDALTMARPYKKAFTHEEAMDIILKGDGRTDPAHFDPRVLEALKRLWNEFLAIKISGGEDL